LKKPAPCNLSIKIICVCVFILKIYRDMCDNQKRNSNENLKKKVLKLINSHSRYII
jgi:hypothetical protein